MDIRPRGEIPPRNGNGRDLHRSPGTAPFQDSPAAALPAHGEETARGPGALATKVALLRSLPLFADLPPGELIRIADTSITRDYRRRQAIYFPGDQANALCVVGQGRVKISRLWEDGKEVTLFLAGGGEPFGEECLLGTAVREAIAEALEAARVLRIPSGILAPLLHSHPGFALAMANLMSGRRRIAESRLEEMIFRTVRGRLAALIARLARSHGRATDGGILLDLALAHQDLAGQIGSTRETTTLTLNEFRRGGLLRIHHCRILIRDLAGLEAIA
jgi:CRP/FNR family transcriptional regulator, cyclic AMP receptor protein